jgi:formylglycine-generating enzyme required for sulfatase activity
VKTPPTIAILALGITAAALLAWIAVAGGSAWSGWHGDPVDGEERTLAAAPPGKVADATRESPYVNGLGMRFVPMAGTRVLFSVWDTRVQDYQRFARETGRDWSPEIVESKSGPPFLNWSWIHSKQCINYHPLIYKLFSGNRTIHFKPGPTHPAVNVSWNEARAFCKWLTWKERKAGRIDGNQVYRLPTDEEWSLAAGLPAEAGSTPEEKDSKVEGVYPWGTKWPPAKGAGNYNSIANTDMYDYTSPVGSFPANQYGLCDMGGNVWQWCEDLYTPMDEPRVARGGSWQDYYPDVLLSSYRGRSDPGRSSSDFGFRCVLAPSGR